MSKAAQRYLSFDFGTKHIGVAVGQTISESAQGLCQIKAQDGIPEWEELDKLIKEWKPDALVIGLPLNMDGSESQMSTRARKFHNRLADRYALPCYMMDERLSSREVKSRQTDSGKNLSQEIDSLAAAVILESWMALQKSNT